MTQYLMGIDNGLTLSKVAIFDLDGRTIGVASRKIEVQYPKPGYTERDMDVIWQKTAEAIHEVIEASGITAARHLGDRELGPRQRPLHAGSRGPGVPPQHRLHGWPRRRNRGRVEPTWRRP